MSEESIESKEELEKEVLLEFVNVQRGTVMAMIQKLKLGIEIDLEPLLESLNMEKDYIEDPRNIPGHII